MAEVEIGKVTHYFSKAGVVAIQITQDVLRVGDMIHVKGHTSDFTQKIDSMQIDNKPVVEAVVGKPSDCGSRTTPANTIKCSRSFRSKPARLN